MKMDIKTQLHEGMKIAPLENQKLEYTLIKSKKDNKMYGLHRQHIIKLDDMNKDELDNKWICTDLSSLQEEIQCIEFENGEIISFEDFCIYELSKSFNNWNNDGDFTEVSMRKIGMTREKYNILKGFTYEIRCRDIIAKEYEKQQLNIKKLPQDTM